MCPWSVSKNLLIRWTPTFACLRRNETYLPIPRRQTKSFHRLYNIARHIDVLQTLKRRCVCTGFDWRNINISYFKYDIIWTELWEHLFSDNTGLLAFTLCFSAFIFHWHVQIFTDKLFFSNTLFPCLLTTVFRQSLKGNMEV